ncbi:hypothetical protein J1614_011036 [Plenodomus biglobosus]|nr:hypothetical protein J1614_011036 [Plenodomus biglobosus]
MGHGYFSSPKPARRRALATSPSSVHPHSFTVASIGFGISRGHVHAYVTDLGLRIRDRRGARPCCEQLPICST